MVEIAKAKRECEFGEPKGSCDGVPARGRPLGSVATAFRFRTNSSRNAVIYSLPSRALKHASAFPETAPPRPDARFNRAAGRRLTECFPDSPDQGKSCGSDKASKQAPSRPVFAHALTIKWAVASPSCSGAKPSFRAAGQPPTLFARPFGTRHGPSIRPVTRRTICASARCPRAAWAFWAIRGDEAGAEAPMPELYARQASSAGIAVALDKRSAFQLKFID